MAGDPGELGQFLRTRRGKLTPADVGLPTQGRRRTHGLRRDEVADLAAISADWYTRLEQGRRVRASPEVLDNLARVLRLDEIERQHLFHLARGEPPPIRTAPADDVPAYLHQFVRYLDPSPAMLLGRRLDVLDANDTAAEYFGHYTDWPEDRRNLVARLCLDPAMRQLLGADWAEITSHMVAQLRVAAALWPGDPAFTALITNLRDRSPSFRNWWANHRVRGSSGGPVVLQHPRHGPTTFEHMAFHPTDAEHLRVVVYLPGQHQNVPEP